MAPVGNEGAVMDMCVDIGRKYEEARRQGSALHLVCPIMLRRIRGASRKLSEQFVCLAYPPPYALRRPVDEWGKLNVDQDQRYGIRFDNEKSTITLSSI